VVKNLVLVNLLKRAREALDEALPAVEADEKAADKEWPNEDTTKIAPAMFFLICQIDRALDQEAQDAR